MPFGQLVIGPPGSGKTTYCAGMEQILTAMGRKVVVVNLDPANDFVPYESKVDLRELVTLTEVMERLELGPNGGLLYCMEFLEKNLDWLKEKLDALQDHYLLFDCPGQAELYTHHNCVRRIVDKLQRWGIRLTAIHLLDAYYCSVPTNYISGVLLSLSTMLHLELPHINVLSKVDLIERYGKLAFDLEFFTNVGDLTYLNERLDDDPMLGKRFVRLNQALCELVEDFSLVSFLTLNIQDKESVVDLIKHIDKSNGYIYGSLTTGNDAIRAIAEGPLWEYAKVADVQERYMQDDDGELWAGEEEEEDEEHNGEDETQS
ncbi:GPN-loop GTPase 2 [Balamuthia mandrillaris]